MNDKIFYFKHFYCRHSVSAMKIGVDAVLLGAWADVSGRKILDVGTGCGIIAIMCAQRNPNAIVFGIDIDKPSVAEAALNFTDSPWKNNLKALLEDYNNISLKNIDLIVSNPPYFSSGIKEPDSARLLARHESTLSPFILLKRAKTLLSACGRVSMIIPSNRKNEIVDYACSLGYSLKRLCMVKDNPKAVYKRCLLELALTHNIEEIILSEIILKNENGSPSEAYINLCKDFYLKF